MTDLVQSHFSLEETGPERRNNLLKAILCVYSCFDFEVILGVISLGIYNCGILHCVLHFYLVAFT